MLNRISLIILFFLCLSICLFSQKGVTYPSRYYQVPTVIQNPNGTMPSSYAPFCFDEVNGVFYVSNGGTNWSPLGGSSFTVDVDSIIFNGVSQEVPYLSNIRQNIASGNVFATVVSSKGGVSMSTNATNGEITFSVPLGCEILSISLALNTEALSAGNDLFIYFDYVGLRTFNNSVNNALMPTVFVAASNTPSRVSPMLFTVDGMANVDVGVSGVGQGDGSDIEIAILDLLIAPNIRLDLKF